MPYAIAQVGTLISLGLYDTKNLSVNYKSKLEDQLVGCTHAADVKALSNQKCLNIDLYKRLSRYLLHKVAYFFVMTSIFNTEADV